MKKLLFLINTLNVGGAEKVLVNTVSSLDPKKYRITVQTVLDSGENKQDLPPDVRYKTMIRTKNLFLCKLLSKLLLEFLGPGFVYRFYVKDDYDYEIAFLEGQPTRILSRSDNRLAKKYAWVHTDLNVYPNSAYCYGSEKGEEAAYRRYDRVFCVSETVRNEFLKKYPIGEDCVDVVYNILDDRAVCEAAKEAGALPAGPKPVLISVGRLVPQKGYERLLRVHLRLVREGLRHSLVIIGDGEQRDALAGFVRQNGLDDTVSFLGYQSNPYQYINKADLFVCSSYAEGFSTVVSEAVLCGTPVLSTEVAGAREPVENPRCSIIIENSEEALYKGLRSLLQDSAKLKDLAEDLESRKVSLRKEYLIAEFERKLFKHPGRRT